VEAGRLRAVIQGGPSGRARLRPCPRCRGQALSSACWDCDGFGFQLWHACVACGDTDWAYVNGSGDADGMKCWT
jgi:hypothetical protein